MRDTSPAMEKKYHDLLMQKSGEERLRMAFSMFDSAKAMVRSSILAQFPEVTENELKQKIFLRFYGHEFNEQQKLRILLFLKGA